MADGFERLQLLGRRSRSLDTPANTIPFWSTRAMQVPIEPDSGRFADQMILRHETPITPVITVVAIVADHQVIAGRHHDIAHIAVVMIAEHFRLAAHVVA